MAHHHRAGIAPSDKSVHFPLIDLHLVFKKPSPGVSHGYSSIQSRRQERRLQIKWCIREPDTRLLRNHRRYASRSHSSPRWWQLRQRTTIAINLKDISLVWLSIRTGNFLKTGSTRKLAENIVEAVPRQINNNNGVDRSAKRICLSYIALARIKIMRN